MPNKVFCGVALDDKEKTLIIFGFGRSVSEIDAQHSQRVGNLPYMSVPMHLDHVTIGKSIVRWLSNQGIPPDYAAQLVRDFGKVLCEVFK